MATFSAYDTPLFAHSPIGMGIISLEMRWTHVNASLCAMLGYDASYLTRQDLLATSFSHPDDTARVHAGMHSLLSRELPSFSMRKRCLHALGHVIWSRLTISLYLDCSGEPAYFLAQLQDITDAVNAHAALQRQQDLHKLIADHAQDLIFCIDLLGRFTFISRSASSLLDTTDANVLLLIHPEDRAEARLILERILATNHGELAHLRAVSSGHTLWLECNVQPILEDASITGLACIARDISHHKQLHPRAALIERQHAISSLASSIAHELNNPLGYALSNIQLVSEHLNAAESDPDLRDALHDAHDGTRRALEIIRDLQILAAPAHLDAARHCADTLIHSVVQLASKLSPPPCDILVHPIEPSLRLWVNHPSFNQILLNLLSSAIAALRSTPEPALSIHAHATASGDALILIEDNGAAIPPHIMPHLFDPFVSTRTLNDGLSLAITYRLVQDLGGSISCTSTDALTTFRIYLPTRPPE